MQLTIDISNEQLFDKVLWLLNSFKSDGLKIIENSRDRIKPLLKSEDKDILDFSSFKVDSFKDIDALDYQKSIRNEW